MLLAYKEGKLVFGSSVLYLLGQQVRRSVLGPTGTEKRAGERWQGAERAQAWGSPHIC